MYMSYIINSRYHIYIIYSPHNMSYVYYVLYITLYIYYIYINYILCVIYQSNLLEHIHLSVPRALTKSHTLSPERFTRLSEPCFSLPNRKIKSTLIRVLLELHVIPQNAQHIEASDAVNSTANMGTS